MEIGAWITVSAVIVALGVGTASLVHAKRIQKKQYRHKLLDEIIEWAVECAKFGIKQNKGVVLRKEGKPPVYLLKDDNARWFLGDQPKELEKLQTLGAQSAYIRVLVPPRNTALETNVCRTIDKLIAQLGFLHEYRAQDTDQPISTAETVYINNIEIYENAVNVCKESALIKKKDL